MVGSVLAGWHNAYRSCERPRLRLQIQTWRCARAGVVALHRPSPLALRSPSVLPCAPMRPQQGDLIVDVAFGEKVAKLKGVDDMSKPLILIDG